VQAYKFGLETEYLLIEKDTAYPLWHKELDFEKLYSLIESIPFDDLPSLEGLDPEDAHEKILPYVIEGYHLKDGRGKAIGMMPKGIEIRTPVCQSIKQALNCQDTLLKRLIQKLEKDGLRPVALSHHPLHYEFDAPRAGRRHDFWKWAKEVMTTFGPDINISFPKSISDQLFNLKEDFEQKLNYYAPALTALTLNSPFYKGSLKKYQDGPYIKSIRTFRRSPIAPLIEWHANEDNRIEFKFFEMTSSRNDFEAYFLMVLALTLNNNLKGRATTAEGIYFMGEVSIQGLESPQVQKVLKEFFSSAFQTLDEFHFNSDALSKMKERWETKQTPADHLIEKFNKSNSLKEIIEAL
jgi:hypothetical protein